MAQPWTAVEWAVRPARPDDPAALGRGRSSAEPTARWSGMAERISPGSKACERVAPGHRAPEARGMPGGGARAARGGEPAGAPTPKGGALGWRHRLSRCADQSTDCGTASRCALAPAGTPAVASEGPLPCVAGPPCPVVCLPPHGRERPLGTVWRPRCTTRLEGAGDVVKQGKARLDAWAEAHKRFHLSDLPIQMARARGLNPKKFGGLATHRHEPWKLPLPECIAECYSKRLHRERPPQVVPLAEVAKRQQPSARDKARHPRGRTDT